MVLFISCIGWSGYWRNRLFRRQFRLYCPGHFSWLMKEKKGDKHHLEHIFRFSIAVDWSCCFPWAAPTIAAPTGLLLHISIWMGGGEGGRASHFILHMCSALKMDGREAQAQHLETIVYYNITNICMHNAHIDQNKSRIKIVPQCTHFPLNRD